MINEHVFLESEKLRLVPYLSCFTSRYHEWMSDTELQALTESEPLSLAEEVHNQHSWLGSRDKLTFILLSPYSPSSLPKCASLEREKQFCISSDNNRLVFPSNLSFPPPRSDGSGKKDATCKSVKTVEGVRTWARVGELLDDAGNPYDNTAVSQEAGSEGTNALVPTFFVPSEVRSAWTAGPVEKPPIFPRPVAFVAVGDCNLFLLPDNGGMDESGDDQEGCSSSRRVFEVEVMVADKQFRRKGLAKEAVRLLMLYAVEVLGATDFVAKIIDNNLPSIHLFRDALGFKEYKRVPVFSEIHFVKRVRSAQEEERVGLQWRAGLEGEVIFGPYSLAEHNAVPVISEVPSVV